MSVIVNDVDTRIVSLRISDSRQNTTQTLKTPLIKDTSKYSCVVSSAFTNSTPPLLFEDVVLMAILLKNELGQPFPYTEQQLYHP